ncbi:kinesin-like protein [Athelia psychrophila]|uniref:Kinesin-like protein n=1 Tax=Athelia psychrophila TaxID=1759441 RepID=A0A166AYF2_9AGAM|nr:kinesin-like protein [Fibularhizoctonia sp. CBS 109695]
MVGAGSITVAVRVRPPTDSEAARLPEPCYETNIRGDGALSTPGRVTSTATLRDIIQIVDDRILTFDPDEKDRSRSFMERGFMPPGTKRYKDKRFMFDKVFGHEARQGDVFSATSQPLLKGLFEGYNATVFAYGATGCGKTHTISGTESDPGIIYLTMADLFQRIDDRKDEWKVEVMVTFLEIYNEEIRDLLGEPGAAVPRGGLLIREDKSVKVVGLTELKPASAEEVKEIVLLGNTRRTQSPTLANATSSRSHAVLQVHVTQSARTASLTEQHTMGTLSIIDLAGSERAAATSNMGQRMVEGANINKSLLALGNCINALCENGGVTRHVPYRNSKLTRLLKFSLGGNCKTVMIVCVAPTSIHFDDTHNTLVYAERATKIKTKVVTRNILNVDRHVGRYVEAINRLNIEVAELKAKLSGKVSSETDVVKRKRAEASAEVARAKSDMQTKVDQMQPSIVDGASCTGKISVATAKLGAIHSRLARIDAMASSSSGPLSSDLDAERALLQALAGPEELSIKSDSALSTRMKRASNSDSMFDATLRAVSERRSEKLDEVSIDNVKMDARWRKAEMERAKAEAERDAMKDALATQAEMVVNLVGMVGRCTVMIGEASQVLRSAVEGGKDGMEGTVRAMSASLKTIREKNDEAFVTIVGHSTAGHKGDAQSASSISSFNGHATSFSSSAPEEYQPSQKAKTRRSSSYGVVNSPPRRTYRTPRKSLRSSISQPYRRVSEKEKDKDKDKEKKSVQWRDEAGQGELDDACAQVEPPPVISVVQVELDTSTSPTEKRTMPLGGSDSDWEDEKTEDSVSFMSSSVRDMPTTRSNMGGARRPRASRLDPFFLKPKGPTLDSLTEDDENASPAHRGIPLSDRSINHFNESTNSPGRLHIPKGHDRHHGSPSRRGPSAPKATLSTSKSGRRRSHIGPVRNERARRRSSLIPGPSPDASDSSPRRVEVSMTGSPSKRPRRMSLLSAASRSMSVNNMRAAKSPVPAASGSVNIKPGSAPTWR